MDNTLQPRYPVYVPTKGRHESGYTIRCLLAWNVPFRAVVEPSEEAVYRAAFPTVDYLVLPRDDMRLLGSRNWIRDHAEAEGHARHWQIDDNIDVFRRLVGGKRIKCDPRLALRACEDFTDRYTNIGISGPNYEFFVTDATRKPFQTNCHVYSCSLINHAMPARWRLIYNDDTDLCLQALATGWATVLVNAFVIHKHRTMIVKGGNTADLYQDDGRLVMARSLERVWPGVVRVDRRFQRPQHIVDWQRFHVPLIRRDDYDDVIAAQQGQYDHVRVVAVAEPQSPRIAALVEDQP